jgi:type IV pilus assembly protein PilO
MSTAVVVPPPNSSSVLSGVPKLTARARALLTAMNLHFAGVAALAILVLYLIIHLVVVWRSLGALDANAMDAQRVRLRAAELAAQPLRGLDAKLADSNAEANTFYAKRLPYASSQVAAELGVLTGHAGVRLTRGQYAYNGMLSGENALNEERIDASVSGDYRPVVQFINAAERDRLFFLILGINLTGQQTGVVNLRIRMTTYLRVPNPDEAAAELPTAAAHGESSAAAAGGAR